MHSVLNDRLFSIDDFTLICGPNDSFPIEIHEKITELLEEQKRKKHRAIKLGEEVKIDLVINEHANWEKRWEEIARLAEGVALTCLIMLPVIYFLVNLFSSSENSSSEPSSNDPIVVLCWISAIFAFVRVLNKIVALFIRDHF